MSNVDGYRQIIHGLGYEKVWREVLCRSNNKIKPNYTYISCLQRGLDAEQPKKKKTSD